MAIIRKSDSFPERPVIVTIYGTPGIGKTSMACTAENPILIDTDRGAQRACTRADTIIADKWSDVTEQNKEFPNYKTVIVDTAKAVLDDYLMAHVIEQDYKLGKNKLKAYGAIGDEFKRFINQRRSEGADLVIIAHAKEEKDGDATKFKPDITGQSSDLVLRISDQVGFVTTVNNKRMLTFEPTDRTIGKNVARIADMEIPNENTPEYKTFMADIIANVKASIRTQSIEQIEAQKQMDEFLLQVSDCTDSDGLMVVAAKCGDLTKSMKAAIGKLMKAKAAELKLEYNKEANAYIPIVPKNE